MSSSTIAPADAAIDQHGASVPPPTAAEPVRKSLLDRIGTFPAVLCSFVILKMFYFASFGVGDNDIFWHLRNGEYMFSHLRFPSVDNYSFTVAGAHWLAHEWLAEVFYYGFYRAFHLHGLLLLTAFVPATTAAIMFFLSMRRSGDPFGAGLVTMLASALVAVGDGPRMHHFGWLCFALMLGVLQEYRLERRGPLWTLPIIFCAWINFHGSWVFGFAIFGIILLAGLVPNDLGRMTASPWKREEFLRLLKWGGVSLGALFVNPFGYKLVWYPFEMLLHQKLNLEVVQEWRPFTFVGATGIWVGVTVAAIILFTALTNVRWRIDDMALTIFVLYSACTHERILLPAGIVLATVLSPFLTGLSSYDPAHERRTLNLTLLAAVCVTIVFLFPSEKKLQRQIDFFFPAKAIDYLKAHPQNRLLNDYNWGGYLEFMLPQQKVFIDSRTDIFEYGGVLQSYVNIIRLKDPGKELQHYNIQAVFMDKTTPFQVWMSLQPNWKLEYQDDKSVVYVRKP